jgi:alkanesulfonate monooxygenase SsuD/methylene tetrahydromethanopterin reductase-like flavin-dependent oxidoreductase (luciferase family)
LAKEVATIDQLSDGRFIFGVGAGWNKPEVENHGTEFSKRWRVLRERILAMKTIWTEEEPEFHGEFVNFEKMWSFPKPVQEGGPPIWIGSNSKYVGERVAEYGDGWLPIGGRPGDGTVESVKAACTKRGRSYADLDLALFLAPLNERELEEQLAFGYNHVVFGLPSDSREVVLPVLDKIMALKEKVLR